MSQRIGTFNYKKFYSSTGMTLMEVLITTSLISMISLVLYTSLINGMKVWKKSQQLLTEEDVVIFFDKISSDLRNAYLYSGFDFEGNAQSFAFPSLVQVLPDKNSSLTQGEYIQQMGKVKYYYDRGRAALYRQKANYGQALSGQFSDAQRLADKITQLSFQYYFLNEGKETIESGVKGRIPYAVQVEVEFDDGRNPKVLRKFINIPLGF